MAGLDFKNRVRNKELHRAPFFGVVRHMARLDSARLSCRLMIPSDVLDEVESCLNEIHPTISSKIDAVLG